MSQRPIDWTAVRLRMDVADMAMRDALEPDARKVKAILDARAKALAKVPETVRTTRDAADMVTFGLGRERYAIETRYVREIAPFSDYAPLPGTPEFIVGVTNLRGAILAVMDLRSFFAIPHQGVTDLGHMIVLGGTRAEFAILADSVHGQSMVHTPDILPPAAAGARSAYLKGVLRDATLLLDGAKLLADERLTIDHSRPTS